MHNEQWLQPLSIRLDQKTLGGWKRSEDIYIKKTELLETSELPRVLIQGL